MSGLLAQNVPRDIRPELLAANLAASQPLDVGALLGRHRPFALQPEVNELVAHTQRGGGALGASQPFDSLFDRVHNPELYNCRAVTSTGVELLRSTSVYSRAMNLGSKVKAARQRKGWEIADLARASGVDLKTIAAIEKRDSVRSQFAQQLAAALGVPVDEILSDGEYIFEALDRHKEGMRESLAFLGEPVARMVPLISWVRATDFDEAFDPYAPGDAEDWIPAPKRAGRHAYALRVRGDSMFNPGGPKSYPEGSVIVVDPEKRSPVSGDLVIAKIDGAPEVTFKRYRNEDGRQWLQPLNPTFPRIDDPFKVLGTVLGKWEDA